MQLPTLCVSLMLGPRLIRYRYSNTEPQPSKASNRSSSAASDYRDLNDSTTATNAPDAEGVDKAQLQPNRARSRFGRARVDARTADFSDRVGGPRSSYRVGTSRVRRIEYGGVAGGAGNDDEDEDETFQEKLARLQREIEEVKALGEKADSGASDADKHLVGDLSSVLQDLESSNQRRRAKGAPQHVNGTNGDTSAAAAQKNEQDDAKAEDAAALTAQIASASLPSTAETERALTLASTLEERLATLESTLGLPALALPQSTSAPDASHQRDRPVFVSLAALDRQLAALGNASAPSLSTLASQIQSLTADADALAGARRAAATARKDLRAQGGSGGGGGASRPLSSGSFSNSRPSSYARPGTATTGTDLASNTGADDGGLSSAAATLLAGDESEMSVRLAKLSAALPTIGALAPLVPALLARLGSLRALHERAAGAGAALDEVERAQAGCARDLKEWREAVRGLEGKMTEGRGREEENRRVVEEWVRSLEARMQGLAAK